MLKLRKQFEIYIRILFNVCDFKKSERVRKFYKFKRNAMVLSVIWVFQWNMAAINKYIVLNYRWICFLFRREHRLLCILMLVSRLTLFPIAGAIYGSLKIEFRDLRPLSSKLLPILLILVRISRESRFIKKSPLLPSKPIILVLRIINEGRLLVVTVYTIL